jgi:hypothetical protein
VLGSLRLLDLNLFIREFESSHATSQCRTMRKLRYSDGSEQSSNLCLLQDRYKRLECVFSGEARKVELTSLESGHLWLCDLGFTVRGCYRKPSIR